MSEETKLHKSSSRGAHVGKETLTYGEFICPEHEDFIGKDVSSVQGHSISVHEEYPSKEDVREASKKYREETLPSVEDEGEVETLFNNSSESDAEVGFADDDVEVGEIETILDNIDTVETERKDSESQSGGLTPYLKSLIGL